MKYETLLPLTALTHSDASAMQENEKFVIPHALRIKILKVQVENNTDWNSACEIAAVMLDVEKEKKRVSNEARRLMNSELMSQLNKAKATIAQKQREIAEVDVRRNEDNFRVPCRGCSKMMHFSSRERNWEEIKSTLYRAFESWSHSTCSQ